jgi:two-component system NtrC family response regulator
MTAKQHLLVIEDDHTLNQLLRHELKRLGYSVAGAESRAEAEAHLNRQGWDLILTDARLPDAHVMDFLPMVAGEYPVIVLTAFGSVQEAVSAMKAGAFAYLTKPINLDELELEVKRALGQDAMRRDHQFCKEKLRQRGDMAGGSSALREVNRLIDAVAASDATVLIQGESGVGKELVARAIHDRGPRSARNFVAVDCCTLQEKLFESELFGHEKGAFTGADRQKPGLIEAAEGGTLFLDEIGEVEPALQAKLLRVLETGQYRRVGSVKDLRSHARVVAATNRDLAKVSKEGGFRPDLYYRLSAFTLRIPPLRERREDIPDLVRHFLATRGFNRNVELRIAPAAMDRLLAYHYPGNIRELRNIIERAVILAADSGVIGPEHLAFEADNPNLPGFSLQFPAEPSLEEIERHYLEILTRKYSGHRGRIAQALGVSERNVYRLLERYGLK